MDRRKFLLAVVSSSAVGLAGCTGDDEDGDGNGNENGAGNGDENGMDNGDENGTGNSDGNGTDNGDGNGMDNGDENGTGNGDGNGTGNGDGDGDENGNGQTSPPLGDTAQWEDSFVAELTFDDPESGSGEATVRVNGGNYYQTFEVEEGTFEIYSVDGDLYLVQEGRCFKNPGQGIPQTGTGVDPKDEEQVTGNPDVTPSGRDTIDGEEVYVYEYSQQGEAFTLYVSVDTGRPVRAEFSQGQIDYHSWGEVDPIEPPDIDCQEPGGNGGGGDY